MEFDLKIFFYAGSVPVIGWLIEKVIKPFVKDTRWYPLISIFMGIVFNIVIGLFTNVNLGVAAVLGLMAGMSASGGFDLVKIVKDTIKPKE